ncbi:hypothetical protein Tco_0864948 [Tanacetum coccineum]
MSTAQMSGMKKSIKPEMCNGNQEELIWNSIQSRKASYENQAYLQHTVNDIGSKASITKTTTLPSSVEAEYGMNDGFLMISGMEFRFDLSWNGDIEKWEKVHGGVHKALDWKKSQAVLMKDTGRAISMVRGWVYIMDNQGCDETFGAVHGKEHGNSSIEVL